MFQKAIIGLLGILTGLAGAGVIQLAASPPRGAPIALLPPPAPAGVIVHVIGAVQQPGVYELPDGSRVRDAIEAAGGPVEGAGLEGLNLAAFLSDGAQLQVAFAASARQTGDSSVLIPAEIPGSATPGLGLINLNTASLAELESLPGIGPATAAKIIAYREQVGPFLLVEDLLNVSGIGPATLAEIQPFVTVGP